MTDSYTEHPSAHALTANLRWGKAFSFFCCFSVFLLACMQFRAWGEKVPEQCDPCTNKTNRHVAASAHLKQVNTAWTASGWLVERQLQFPMKQLSHASMTIITDEQFPVQLKPTCSLVRRRRMARVFLTRRSRGSSTCSRQRIQVDRVRNQLCRTACHNR